MYFTTARWLARLVVRDGVVRSPDVHSKRFWLEDALSIGVDRMQRNFEPHASAGGRLAIAAAISGGGETDDLSGIHRR